MTKLKIKIKKKIRKKKKNVVNFFLKRKMKKKKNIKQIKNIKKIFYHLLMTKRDLLKQLG